MQTPAYVFFKDKILENYQTLSQMLPTCEVHYALKANSELEILQVLAEAGASFDIASEGEFDKLISLNVQPERILCSLPVKPDALIERLYQAGCAYFVFDHLEELQKLIRYAPDASKVLRVYVADRIEYDIQYGMTLDELIKLKEEYPQLIEQIDGVTFYSAGSEDIDHFAFIINRCDQFLQELHPTKELILNIGGGYQLNEKMDQAFYAKMNAILEPVRAKYNLKLIVEPGKGIMNTAGAILTEVVMVKERDGHYDVYIDAGDPTGVFRRPTGVIKSQGELLPTKRKQVYRFIGITCNHRVLFIYPLKYEIKKGDILMFLGYGSYSVGYVSQFHAWAKPDILLQEKFDSNS